VIRVARRKAPHGFNERVFRPGTAWLAANPSGRPPSLWLGVKGQVISAFDHRCAYSAMWLSPDGEIDHFVSIDEDRRRAYRWRNYRYVAPWLNRSKQHIRASDLLDPFDVEDDWFALELPSLELGVTFTCPVAVRPRADVMLDRLHLRNGETVMRSRRAFYEHYLAEEVKIGFLDGRAPLIARAIRRAW
jgi:hypothetical protein